MKIDSRGLGGGSRSQVFVGFFGFFYLNIAIAMISVQNSKHSSSTQYIKMSVAQSTESEKGKHIPSYSGDMSYLHSCHKSNNYTVTQWEQW